MLTRPIPSTGEALPVIGLGTYRAFDTSLNPFKKNNLRDVLHLFFEAGGSLIDSSPMYGKAETVTGDLLGSMAAHDKAFIATKVWTNGRQSGIDEMTDSLRKLKSERIELMQVHNLVDCDTQLSTLREWKQDGRIKYIGITHYATSGFDEMGRYIKNYPDIDFCQFPYSIAVRDAEDYFLDLCADNGVATLINRPFEQDGLFRDVRKAALPEWASEFGCNTWGQFFLKYLLSFEPVTCLIPATSNPGHMADNLPAGEGRLPDKREQKMMFDTFDRL